MALVDATSHVSLDESGLSVLKAFASLRITEVDPFDIVPVGRHADSIATPW